MYIWNYCDVKSIWIDAISKFCGWMSKKALWSLSWLLKTESTWKKMRVWDVPLNIITFPIIWLKNLAVTSCHGETRWCPSYDLTQSCILPLPLKNDWRGQELSDKLIQSIKHNTQVVCSNIWDYWQRRDKGHKKNNNLFHLCEV